MVSGNLVYLVSGTNKIKEIAEIVENEPYTTNGIGNQNNSPLKIIT